MSKESMIKLAITLRTALAACFITGYAQAENASEWSVVMTEQGGDEKVARAFLIKNDGQVIHIDGFSRRVCSVSLAKEDIDLILAVRSEITQVPDHSDGMSYRIPPWYDELRIDIHLNVGEGKDVFQYSDAREVPSWLRVYRNNISRLTRGYCPFNFER